MQANIACGPKSTISEFAQSEFAAEIDAFEKIPTASGTLNFVRHPLVEPGATEIAPAPRLGEHTIELLRRAGYTAEQTAELKARGVINYP